MNHQRNRRICQRASQPVDIASIVVFRIAFGLILAWEVWRYIDNDWIRRYYVEPMFYFPYPGFSWVRPWPGEGMHLHFLLLGVVAILVAVGYRYRVSSILLFLGITYVFLLDETQYLNHFYLLCLLSFTLCFIPAHRSLSSDVARWPEFQTDVAPAWMLWLLRAQVGIVYFYGGIAKLNFDWLRGEPMRIWLGQRVDFPLLGQWFTEEWMVYTFSYGGLLFDLLVVPALLWKRSRTFAFVVAVVFHLMNARLFSIGIFPWFMIAATTIFFNPGWPRFKGQWWPPKVETSATSYYTTCWPPSTWITATVLAIYVGIQLLFPLRHFLYPGNVSWTEEGHRFSWHMKLRTKQADAFFIVRDPETRTERTIDPALYLTPRQLSKMAGRPYMIFQFSHYLSKHLAPQQGRELEVYAYVQASLNGRDYQSLIDPEVDLTNQELSLRSAEWIVPLVE